MKKTTIDLFYKQTDIMAANLIVFALISKKKNRLANSDTEIWVTALSEINHGAKSAGLKVKW